MEGKAMKKLLSGFFATFFLAVSAQPMIADSASFVTGSGIITEGQGRDASEITFGVQIFIDEAGECSGNFAINFHNTDNADVDQGVFTANEFTYIDIGTASYEYPAGVFTDYTYAYIGANGRFNGEDDWSVRVNFADFGKSNRAKANADMPSDAVRVQLIDNFAAETVYETPQDFSTEQEQRTLLDGGNVAVYNEQ
jgi:hypothetical protein